MSFLALPDSCAGSQPDSMLLVPCGDTFCLLSKGRRLAAHAFATFPQTQARDRREEGTAPASPPSFAPTLMPQACWNVTGVVARACPNSRNTCFSPQGLLQPPALFGLTGGGGVGGGGKRLFLCSESPRVAISSAHRGACCPRAAAQRIAGASRNPEELRDLAGHLAQPCA